MLATLTSRIFFSTPRHTTHYVECGPADGPLMIFPHGAYASEAPDGGRLSQPVLFLSGEWDGICSITGNRLEDPMRRPHGDERA